MYLHITVHFCLQGKKEALLARLQEATLAERGAQQTAGDAKMPQKQAVEEEAGNTRTIKEVEKLKVLPPHPLFPHSCYRHSSNWLSGLESELSRQQLVIV